MARSGSSWKRITSIADISSSKVGPASSFLRGRVVAVNDGDTFRFRHLPTRFHSSQLGDQKMADVTLPIRICTIDTPEIAKFGKHGQPFGEEAKDYLKAMIMERIVNVRVLEKDQYGRGVAEVYRPGPFLGWPRKYMDEEMLKVSSNGTCIVRTIHPTIQNGLHRIQSFLNSQGGSRGSLRRSWGCVWTQEKGSLSSDAIKGRTKKSRDVVIKESRVSC